MVEDDTFTYHVKQLAANKINTANTAVHSLITKERMQKLDLLIHLLSNLPQALVVCGPEGIGKTTLLEILQGRKTELWRYCLIQGNTDLSFEAVLKQLAKSTQSLTTALDQPKQIVLIIDNAGELVPGLIATVIQYAAANPVLRVIFALTHDELQVKRGSDRAVEDCHIVEIPPLSEKQCGDFLQHLSTKPSANVSFKAIGESMITHIYRETHGVPGRIIAKVSGLSDAKQGGKLKWLLALAVVAAVAIAVVAQWLLSSANAPGITQPPASMQPSKTNATKAIEPAAIERKTDNVVVVPPQAETQIMLTLPTAGEGGIQAEDALEPSVEVNTSKEVLQPAVQAKTDAERALLKPSALDALGSSAQPLPLEAKQEKKKQPELSKAANNVDSTSSENSAIKAQPGSVSAVGTSQKQDNKKFEAMQLWAKQEKLKQEQAELRKSLNSVEPFKPDTLETIQIPQKPVDVTAVPEEGVRPTEAATLQQVESGGISASTANNFTLQLMVLSKQSSVNDILKKYPAMESGIRVINTIANGKEKFVLEYGAYPDIASANKARQSLPFEFRDALARKISPIKPR